MYLFFIDDPCNKETGNMIIGSDRLARDPKYNGFYKVKKRGSMYDGTLINKEAIKLILHV